MDRENDGKRLVPQDRENSTGHLNVDLMRHQVLERQGKPVARPNDRGVQLHPRSVPNQAELVVLIGEPAELRVPHFEVWLEIDLGQRPMGANEIVGRNEQVQVSVRSRREVSVEQQRERRTLERDELNACSLKYTSDLE